MSTSTRVRGEINPEKQNCAESNFIREEFTDFNNSLQ